MSKKSHSNITQKSSTNPVTVNPTEKLIEFAQTIFKERLAHHHDNGFIDEITYQNLTAAIARLSAANFHDSESLLVYFATIDAGLKQYKRQMTNRDTLRLALAGLLVGSIASVVIICCFPMMPLWALSIAPTLSMISGVFNAHKGASLAARNHYDFLKKQLHEKVLAELVCEAHYMDEAARLIAEDSSLQALKSSFLALKQRILIKFKQGHLKLEETVKMHQAMNQMVQALHENKPNEAMLYLENLQQQISNSEIKTFTAAKTFMLAAVGIGLLFLAASILSGGSLAVVTALVAATIKMGLIGAGIDLLTYHTEKKSNEGHFKPFKSAVVSQIGFFQAEAKDRRVEKKEKAIADERLQLVVVTK